MALRWAAALRRPLVAIFLASVAAALVLVLFDAAQTLVGEAAAWVWVLASAASLAIAIPTVEPIRRRVEAWVEGTFFPDRARARRGIHDAIREIARIRGEDELALFVREALDESLDASAVRLLAGQPGAALCEIGSISAEPLVLAAGDPLREALARGAAVAAGSAPERAGSAEASLQALGMSFALGLPPQPQLEGGILVGPRSDGSAYDGDDRALLEALAGQATIAIANARTWEGIRALEQRLREENVVLRGEVLPELAAEDLVGRSVAFRSVLAQIQQVAPTDATVLVLGDTGTGKERVAAAIHRASRRAERTFVPVACAAIPETLLESELFGSERGAFTGATARKLGRFEIADGGTLFLDDVDTLPVPVQAKLLRALQEGEVQRLGSPVARKVDVRVVAASNRDLLAEVRAGRFREDLYYRLHVVPIRLPPLRERREDIPLLVQHFVEREGKRLGREIHDIPKETLEALQAYAWPGNVRELRNVVERALVMSTGGSLRLPGPLEAASAAGANGSVEERARADLGKASMAELVRRYKAHLVRSALARSQGNQRRAAELLGIHRPSLTRMLRDLDSPPE
jgi:transcriptional regulator with GAF, ATPase, and Fis domain